MRIASGLITMYIFFFQVKYDICGAVLSWLILCIRKVLALSCAKTQLQLSSDIQARIRIGWGHQIKSGAFIEHCNYHPPPTVIETKNRSCIHLHYCSMLTFHPSIQTDPSTQTAINNTSDLTLPFACTPLQRQQICEGPCPPCSARCRH